MIRNVLSVTAAALFLTLASACATTSGTTANPQPEAQPAAAPAQSTAADPATAPAKTAAPAQVASTDPAAKKEFHPDDMVCRVYEVTGTRINKQRICKTRAQWIEAARAAQESIRTLQGQNAAQPGGDNLIQGGQPR